MKKTVQGIIFFVAIILVNIISNIELSHNQEKGVYPIDADSIGIPIMQNIIISAIILLIFVVGLWLIKPNKKYLRFSGIVFCSMAAILSLLVGLDWFSPNHYFIAASFMSTSCIAAFFTYLTTAKGTSNLCIKRDCQH